MTLRNVSQVLRHAVATSSAPGATLCNVHAPSFFAAFWPLREELDDVVHQSIVVVDPRGREVRGRELGLFRGLGLHGRRLSRTLNKLGISPAAGPGSSPGTKAKYCKTRDVAMSFRNSSNWLCSVANCARTSPRSSVVWACTTRPWIDVRITLAFARRRAIGASAIPFLFWGRAHARVHRAQTTADECELVAVAVPQRWRVGAQQRGHH